MISAYKWIKNGRPQYSINVRITLFRPLDTWINRLYVKCCCKAMWADEGFVRSFYCIAVKLLLPFQQ